MTQDTTEKVRRLLQPTHDSEGWHAQVNTLNVAEAAPLLSTAVNNEKETPQARRQAATILGRLRQKSSIPSLLQALAAADPVLRARVANALGQFADVPDQAVQQLVKHLDDEDYLVREQCAKALALLKRSEGLGALQRMQGSDSVESNREVAQNAIAAIRGERTTC
jgi:HEAT repeat protein